MTVPRAAARAARELAPVLHAFHAATGAHASLWALPTEGGAVPHRLGGSARIATPTAWPNSAAAVRHAVAIDSDGGPLLVIAAAPGASAWLVVGPRDDGAAPAPALVDLLGPIVRQELQGATEAEHAARELTERYEEINLLYTISEILGRAVQLEETASTILTEVSETVGARRAAILVHDRVTDTLQSAAVIGTDADELPPVAVDDPQSVVARVFRTLHPVIDERDGPPAAAEHAFRDGALLCVPIVWSTPDGGEPLGIVALSGRRGGHHFTAGDLKLVTAIASQIAAAIQNARLVRASIQQQRLSQEMALAHDLQMALLPRPDVVAPEARVAARVVPAESVGGDFYHLFRLGGGRVGVMIGDVSSHGYRAALIMALAMSAAAIHAQRSDDPASTLGAVLGSLGEELASTEMFISTFYAVVDPAAGMIRYANAGHPHAFVIDADGTATRLAAGAPPLGMVPFGPPAATHPWRAGRDALVLFTDGVSEARDQAGAALGEARALDAARAAAADAPEVTAQHILDAVDAHAAGLPPRDDITVVVLRD